MKRSLSVLISTSAILLLSAQGTVAAEKKGTVSRPAPLTLASDTATAPGELVDQLEKQLLDAVSRTGSGGKFAPLAVRAQERLKSYREASVAEPNNRLLPQMLRTAELLTRAAIAEAEAIGVRTLLDSLEKEYRATQAAIRKVQAQIIQHEQGNVSRLKGTLAVNEQLLDEEKRRATEYAELMAKEQQRAEDYSLLADQERTKATQYSQLAAEEKQRADEATRRAEEELLRAAQAERLADSLRAEAQKRQDEARNRLNALQSKLIQVTQDARGIILSMSDILFAVNKADLTPDLQQNLAKIAGILTVYKEARVIVEGHTDNTGSAEHNQKLSELRAGNVRDYLVKMGLEKGRLRSVGFGMTKPVAPNTTAEGRQKNRRVDLVISDPQLEGK